MANDEQQSSTAAQQSSADQVEDNFGAPETIAKRYEDIVGHLLDSNSPLNLEFLLDLVTNIILTQTHAKESEKSEELRVFVDEYKDFVDCLIDRVSNNDFKILRKLGEGAFGAVYCCMEKSSRKYYALKRCPKEKIDATSPTFITEKKIMMTSNSPWIPRVYYCYQNTKHIYFVMEILAGGSIEDLLDNYYPIEEETCTILSAYMISGVKAVHDMGYIHRDIKPENFFLDSHGLIKIGDFGLAKKMVNNQWHTVKHAGTPEYMCKELFETMIKGITRQFSTKTDWWAVGVSCHQLRYGYSMFEQSEESQPDTQAQVMQHDPENINYNPDPNEVVEFSDPYKEMIKGLLQDEDKRWTYDECVKCEFLNKIVWKDLHLQTPPLVPEVNPDLYTEKPDDIMNFNKNKASFKSDSLLYSGFTETRGNVIQKAIEKSLGVKSGGKQSGGDSISAEASAKLTKEIESLKKSLEQTNVQHENDLKLKNEALEELKTIRISLIEQEGKSKSLQSQLNQVQKEAENLKGQISDLKALKNQNEEAIESLNKKIKEKEKEKSSLTAQVKTNSDNVTNLEGKLEALKQKLKKVEKEKAEAEAKVHDAIAKVSTQKSLEKSLENMNMSTHQHVEEISQLNSQISQFESMCDQLKKQLDEEVKQVETLTTKIDKSNSEISNLKHEITTLTQQNTETSSELSEKTKKVDQLKVSNEQITEKLDAANSKLSEAEGKEISLQNQINLKENLIVEHKKQIEDLNAQIQENSHIKSKAKKYKKQVVEWTDKYEKAKNAMENVVESREKLLMDHEKTTAEKKKMEEDYAIKIHESNVQLSQMESQKRQLMKAYEMVYNQLPQKNRKKISPVDVQSKLRQAESERNRLRNEKKIFEDRIKTLVEEKAQMSTQIDQISMAHNEKIKKLEQLNVALRTKVHQLGGDAAGDDASEMTETSHSIAQRGVTSSSQNVKHSAAASSSSASVTVKTPASHQVNNADSEEKIKAIVKKFMSSFQHGTKTVYNIDDRVMSVKCRTMPLKTKFKGLDKWPKCQLIIDFSTRTLMIIEEGKEVLEYETAVCFSNTPMGIKGIPKGYEKCALEIKMGVRKSQNAGVAVDPSVERSKSIRVLLNSAEPTKNHLIKANTTTHKFKLDNITDPTATCIVCGEQMMSVHDKSVIDSQCTQCRLYMHQRHTHESHTMKTIRPCAKVIFQKVIVFETAIEMSTWNDMIQAMHFILPRSGA